ncbi:uncharacterized, partial [Tachysurus ichikawai]
CQSRDVLQGRVTRAFRRNVCIQHWMKERHVPDEATDEQRQG